MIVCAQVVGRSRSAREVSRRLTSGMPAERIIQWLEHRELVVARDAQEARPRPPPAGRSTSRSARSAASWSPNARRTPHGCTTSTGAGSSSSSPSSIAAGASRRRLRRPPAMRDSTCRCCAHDEVVAGLGGRPITKASLHRVLRDDFGATVAQASLTNENAAICRASGGTATGIRTPVSAVRGRRPSPLDDSGRPA